MFKFKPVFESAKSHPGAFFLVLLVAVVFVSAPFLFVWRLVKKVPGVGAVASKIPGAAQ